MHDPYDLDRFVGAQDAGGTDASALAELRAGRKTSHWMWFVFPQLAGLGQSPISKRFAIASIDEAGAFLRHPVLGPRLIECVNVLNATRDRDVEQIFGPSDAKKLGSCLTLFLRAAPDEPAFAQALARYFAGTLDEATERLLLP